MPQMKGMKELRLLVQQLQPGRYGGDGRSLFRHICFLVFTFLCALASLPGAPFFLAES
jgi:hypothetical protein